MRGGAFPRYFIGTCSSVIRNVGDLRFLRLSDRATLAALGNAVNVEIMHRVAEGPLHRVLVFRSIARATNAVTTTLRGYEPT